MRSATALLIALSLAACATAVTSVSRDHVSIKYDRWVDSDEKLQRWADEQCADFGRRAVFERKTIGGGLEAIADGYAHYRCVD